MSTRFPIIKDKLTSIKSKLTTIKGMEDYENSLKARLVKVENILIENESKIWLKTKVGEPMLKELQESVEKAYKALEAGSFGDFEVVLKDVEAKAAKIDAESQRRNMVVT